LKRRELFHLSPLFVGHFSFFKYFSFIADRWRCGRVDVSVSVCNCASLLFNFVVSVHVWNSGVDKFLNVIALLCITFQRCDSTACGYSSAVDTTRR
jgi:hypothetical protein